MEGLGSRVYEHRQEIPVEEAESGDGRQIFRHGPTQVMLIREVGACVVGHADCISYVGTK